MQSVYRAPLGNLSGRFEEMFDIYLVASVRINIFPSSLFPCPHKKSNFREIIIIFFVRPYTFTEIQFPKTIGLHLK